MVVRVLDGPSVAAGTLVRLKEVLARLHRELLHPLQGAEAARRAAHQATDSDDQQHPAAHMQLQWRSGRNNK